MRRTVRLAVALAAVLTGAPLLDAQTPLQGTLAPEKGPSHVALRKWLEAVRLHRVGEADAAAQAIASWTSEDLEHLLPGIVWYLDYGRRALQKQPSRVSEPDAVCPSCDASHRERQRLLRSTRRRAPDNGLLRDFPLPNRLNDLIIRGVMLHSDAAMQFRVASIPVRELGPFERAGDPATSYNVLQLPPEVVNSGDGQFVGRTTAVGHWYMARALLQFMTPEPELAPHTKQWYLAATTYFAARTDFAQLEPHFAAAQVLFPNDATLAFDRGWQSEIAATPLVQHDVRALLAAALGQGPAAPARFTARYCGLIVPCDKDKNPYGIKSERESLADAERYFARAIALDATMTEAYVRLAHVRVLLGRHADALAVLSMLPPSGDDIVTFYAALIEGKALEELGRLDEALAAYQRGHDLFPNAQSANLALSGVEQRRGEAPRAMAFARRAVDPPQHESQAFDPFAAYIFGRGRSSADAWEALISALEPLQ